MNAHSIAYRYWRTTALVGVCLVVVGVGAGYFDVVSHFEFEFISDHFEIFGLMMLVGMLLAFVACIGWAKHLGKQRRALMAIVVFCLPWAALLLGYPVAGANIHGPAVLAMLLIIPATILAVILLIMAMLTPEEEKLNGST